MKGFIIPDEEAPLPKERSKANKKKNASYVKSTDQKESSNRQKNTEYWRTTYGIYVVPTNQEDYYWFKQNASLVRKVLPIINKVRELQIPFNERK